MYGDGGMLLITHSHPAPRTAVVYARLSKDDRTERIESQVRRCTKFCESRGIEVVDVLTEDEASASRYAARSRPRYQEAIRLVESGAVDAICAWDLDRLWRQPRELEHLVTMVEEKRGWVLTVGGRYDLTARPLAAPCAATTTWSPPRATH